jgi:hypothetical protein
VATKSLAPALLLVAALAGCGGGAEPAAAPAVDPTAGLEDTPGAPAQTGATPPKPVRRSDESMIPAPGAALTRETYAYAGGPRDPFASALEGVSTGPEFPDLELTTIVLMRPPSPSIAVLRDRLSGKSYTVREGERLGRMRIASIRQRDVTFSIDDYGTERQETLSIRKPEGNSP